MAIDKKSGSGDTYVINKSLQKVAKGAGIVFIGLLVSLFFGLIGRLLIARYWTQSDYGVFSLAIAVLSMCMVISTLGLRQGASRSIAYSVGKAKYKGLPGIISASIWFSIIASILLGSILFLLSESIAEYIFHEPALIVPLRIFSVAVPFLTLINVVAAIFRGFGQIKPTVYFQSVLMSILFPIFLIGVIVFNLSFINVFYAYAISLVVTCILLIIYAIKQIPSLAIFSPKLITNSAAKELLFFSLPLLGTAMLVMIISWTDTLMLGSLKSSVDVGLYNAVLPLAQFISFPLGALLVVYMPAISGLYARGMTDEIKRNFSILTKWICLVTLPLFIVLFLFPEAILSLLFGPTYVFSADALRILSLGFIINNFLGPNGATLIAMGKSRFIMFASLATAILNIGLNIILIPPFGIEGAAIASVVSIVSINLMKCWKLYSLNGAQPLSKNLIKPTLVSLGLITIIHFISQNFLTIRIWMIPLFFILYYAIYILAILLTKSLDQEDLKMLTEIERKTGIKSTLIKRFLAKFL